MERYKGEYTCGGIQIKFNIEGNYREIHGVKRSYTNDIWMEIGTNTENNTGGYINTWRGTWRDTYDGRREGLIHMERPRYLQQFGGKITSGQAPVLGRLITKYLHLFVRVPISGSSTRSAL